MDLIASTILCSSLESLMLITLFASGFGSSTSYLLLIALIFASIFKGMKASY
jgi:hypothetical protein